MRDFIRHFLQQVDASRYDRQATAFLRQEGRDRAAKSHAGAGDQRDFACELKIHVIAPFDGLITHVGPAL